MYRDGTLEELIKDLEEERASKRLRELDPELLLKPDIWIVTPEEGACEKCKSFAKKLFLKNHNVLIQTANVKYNESYPKKQLKGIDKKYTYCYRSLEGRYFCLFFCFFQQLQLLMYI